ncbi:unnamed protein product [Ambrosiozyma monospora]|uniref:Unnamed protein product n=1 Tax=Ambrosiozyma monospora TaxID=43982 RepID=A0ACB5TZN3_AMBMO|nr:unnamed protein product [Ambrosiozyma monospora]
MSNSKKVLLMGRSCSGKSSMRSMIFSNYNPFETRMLGPTIDIEHSNLKFLSSMTLNLWDCGGQSGFMEGYLGGNGGKENPNVFKKTEVLIYVFDVESREINADIETFKRVLKNLAKYSPNVVVFTLIHKMDLVQAPKRQDVFDVMRGRVDAAASSFNMTAVSFPTSIWDESLYKAWSKIVCSLIPNLQKPLLW